MKKIVILVIFVLLILSGCSGASVNNAGNEVVDTIASISSTDNRYVQMVRDGYSNANSYVTYGEAFDIFFATPRWKYFESEDGQKVVEFTGDCLYYDTQVKARLQFVIDEENGVFEAKYLAFNEVPQNLLTLVALLEAAFNDAEAAGLGNDNSYYEEPVVVTEDTEGFIYKGFNICNFVGAQSSDVARALGWSVDSDRNDDIRLYIYDNGEIESVEVWAPEVLTVDGVSLDKNRYGLIAMFGQPDSESFEAGYCMKYKVFDRTVIFELGAYDGEVWRFTIY